MSDKILCDYCIKEITQNNYLAHVQKFHEENFLEIMKHIIQMNNDGYTTDEIAKKFNINESSVFKKLKDLSKNSNDIKEPLRISKWEPHDFKLEATTVWSFPDRGDWATHNGTYRGNWSPYIPRNIILRYSNEDDLVLDQFVGSGTTLVETKLLKRKGIGVDINPKAIEIAKNNVRFRRNNEYDPLIIHGDARKLDFIDNNEVDLVCTHPPYANIIKYSDGIKGDLSLLDIDEFLEEIKNVAKEAIRVLKKGKYCVILIGDTRRHKHIIPLGFRVMDKFLEAGFALKETIIKEQHNCKSTGFWYKRSIENNFLLIAHEYLFVFRKQ